MDDREPIWTGTPPGSTKRAETLLSDVHGLDLRNPEDHAVIKTTLNNLDISSVAYLASDVSWRWRRWLTQVCIY
jgi:hypothetical protein